MVIVRVTMLQFGEWILGSLILGSLTGCPNRLDGGPDCDCVNPDGANSDAINNGLSNVYAQKMKRSV